MRTNTSISAQITTIKCSTLMAADKDRSLPRELWQCNKVEQATHGIII